MNIIVNDEFKNKQMNLEKNNTVVMITPPINEEYYVAKVELYKDQSINLFPKFSTYGIGFAQEENWNTNLPYQCNTEKIYHHILENKKYDEISKKECIKAIEILQDIAEKIMSAKGV